MPNSPSPERPPVAAKRPVARRLWGTSAVDEYAWLSDKEDPDVLRLLTQEREYALAVLGANADLEAQLFDELKQRIKETDLSVPVTKDGWTYYVRSSEGLSYAIHCRKPAGTEAEQILLDENVESAGLDYFEIGVFEIDTDHRFLLWGVDTSGQERFELRVRSIDPNGAINDLGDSLVGTSYGSAWAADADYFFYTTADEANRTDKVWRHRLGHPQDEDVLVFVEDDQKFSCTVGRDGDDRHIMIHTSSVTSDEMWFIRSDEPCSDFTCIQPRQDGLEYSATFRDESLVILTNRESSGFSVMSTPQPDAGAEAWLSLVAPRPAIMVTGIDVFDDYLVLFELSGGLNRIRIIEWDQIDSGLGYLLDQPEEVYSTWSGANVESSTQLLRYGYSSMVTPPSVYTVDMASREKTLLKMTEVLGGFDPDDYATERIWAESDDGTSVPISLVWRKDRVPGPGPAVLYGYGAYEISSDPVFSTARLLLLDRGFVFAIAHVRGGGEMGREWYEGAKYEKKPNSFLDFNACARHLIQQGWTSPDRLVARGGSAGGLLVAAALNLEPDLYRAVVAQVPFVDVLNTMSNPELPLTIGEWEEWGNPLDSELIFTTMAAYSPYENIPDAALPSVLATTGLNDPRVSYWEPAKWIQRLRDHNRGPNPMLLIPDLESGHGGPSGRYDAWRDEARVLAFIISRATNP